MTRTIAALVTLAAPGTALAHGIHTDVGRDHGIGLATCLALVVAVLVLVYLADRIDRRQGRD